MWLQKRRRLYRLFVTKRDDCAAMCYLKVTIEDVNFTVKRNFKEIMTQTLVPNHLVIDSSLQPDWERVDSIRVAFVYEVFNKRLHIWITTIVRILERFDVIDAVAFEFIAEQIRAIYAVNTKMIRDEFLITSESLRHDASVVDVLFD